MNQMHHLRRRLHRLEQLPQLKPPPSPLEQIRQLAIKHVSNEELQLMINVARDQEAGVRRTLSPSEEAAWATQDAALEMEAREMGFKSYADAERREGGRR